MPFNIFEFASPEYRDPPKKETLILRIPYYTVVGYVLFICPATGWPFDGASIPRVFWRVVGPPMRALYRRAALLHDCAYKGLLIAVDYFPSTDADIIARGLLSHPQAIPEGVMQRERVEVTKRDADNLLRDIAIWNGTSAHTANILRLGVDNYLGRLAWKREHEKYAKLAS